VLRSKRLLDTIEIEIAALIEKHAQEHSVKSEPGASTGASSSVETGAVSTAAGTHRCWYCLSSSDTAQAQPDHLSSDMALHVKSFVNGLLDDAQTLYGLSSVQWGTAVQ
jgi:hypothetical protein